jgi:NitT/TauT family transport system permease protein
MLIQERGCFKEAKASSTMSKGRLNSVLYPFLATCVLLAGWEAAAVLFEIDTFVLPRPSAISTQVVPYGGAILVNAGITLWTTVAGFACALVFGILLGFVLGVSRLAHQIINPLLVGFNTIPKVALIPLLVVWFGIGQVPAIITSFLLSFFVIAVNVSVGVTTVDKDMLKVMKALHASQWETFQKVGFPHALPYLFASLKIAISQAFIGSVVSEMVASEKGIGYLILSASSNYELPLAFLALMTLGVLGAGLYAVCGLFERIMVPWAEPVAA